MYIYATQSDDAGSFGHCYPPSSAQVGQVWYDSAQQCMVVYTDSNCWVPIGPPSIAVAGRSAEVIDWLSSNFVDMQKMHIIISMIDNFDQLVAKYPAIAQASEELEVLTKLHKDLK
jgi:hypothetical protein